MLRCWLFILNVAKVIPVEVIPVIKKLQLQTTLNARFPTFSLLICLRCSGKKSFWKLTNQNTVGSLGAITACLRQAELRGCIKASIQ